MFRLHSAILALGLLTAAGVVTVAAPAAYAQNSVTGALNGAVVDQTGAVVPNATVTITNTGTGATIKVTSNAEGRYTAANLPPGQYKVSASTTGMQSGTSQINVLVGTTIAADVKVTPTGSKEVIEVTSTTMPLVDTENVALATNFNSEQIQELPAPGGDVTTVAFTAPGVVVNTGGAYGNFSSNGLPGISNLFVLNGFDNEDPFLDLNNSGSSNLTLGQGELAEATVVQNGYNSQYGRAAGAIINYTTKSGTNKFHGMLDYNWNGSLMNANGWFNQNTESASNLPLTRPHAVSNEWAANVGGPIIKDKVFFFADYEGLYYVLPGASGPITFPSTNMDNYTLANVPAAAQSFYGLALADYRKSPAYAVAKPVQGGSGPTQDANNLGGCGAAAAGGMAGMKAPDGTTFGASSPCMVVGTASVNNINKEWLFTGRADWHISDKHSLYGRYKMDRGSQPTSTSFVDPLFSAISIQPEYEGQFNDSYQFSPNKVNVVVLAANWYSAYFGPLSVQSSYAELPMNFYFPDYGLDGSGVNAAPGLPGEGVPYYLTQGRNVTQYQIEDDFSWIHGNHALKFGVNFRRDLVSDYDSQIETIFPYAFMFSLGDFAGGDLSTGAYQGLDQFGQAFTPTNTAHLALYNFGIYAQDEWQTTPKLKLTLGARIDRTGNPLCHNGCFSTYQNAGTFPASGATASTPYNAQIKNQTWNAFPNAEPLEFQPRAGFNYSIDTKTELRGGFGLFSDIYPAAFIDGVVQNFPNYNAVTVYNGVLAPSGTGTTGAFAAAGNTAIVNGFKSGQGLTQINNSLAAQGIPFTPPNMNAVFPSEFRVPMYAEWSFQVQRMIGNTNAIILTYAGNKGYNGILVNPYINATNSTSIQTAATQLDPRFERVQAYTNNGISNYNGGMLTYKHTGNGLTGELSYTWSHSLDDVSNGGSGEPFNGGSVTNQVTPSLSADNLNYSNSDYDVRHNIVGDVIYNEPFKMSNRIANGIVSGWVLGAKTYWHTGVPYSITNGAVLGGIPNLGTTLMPELASGVTAHSLKNITTNDAHGCASSGHCLNIKQFVPYGSQTTFGNLRRNSLFGPHYVDTDVSLLKDLFHHENMTLQLGANAYNLFNKINFNPPVSDISSGAFGIITSAAAPPTSPYGSFQGAAVTQRLFVLHGTFNF